MKQLDVFISYFLALLLTPMSLFAHDPLFSNGELAVIPICIGLLLLWIIIKIVKRFM